MSSPHSTQARTSAKLAARRTSSIRISLTVANRYTFDTDLVTERQIKETAGVPAGFTLYRRTQGGNEPIPDDAGRWLRPGRIAL
jgi:hypothetical protein